MRRVMMIGLGAALLFTGCKSATDKQFEAEQVVIGQPLELDPTEKIELAQWWSNGDHLLRLDNNAAYSLYEGTNRYATPIERGRWSKENYAMLWLEPYNTIRVEPRRVSLTKIDGRLALQLPKLTLMFALPEGPPKVLEDRMIGEWNGSIGTLMLRETLRYNLTPTEGDMTNSAVPQIHAIRKGTWRIADNQLVLQSDIPGIEPLRMPLSVDEQQVTISAPGGIMMKAERQATATP